jgi:hypothetical protein
MFRAAVGAAMGAAAAAAALRLRTLARDRGEGAGYLSVIHDLPGALRQDVDRIGDAARGAIDDGRDAAERTEAEIDRVIAEGRRSSHRASANRERTGT